MDNKYANKVTEYTYKWNSKTQNYVPQGMKVRVEEMVEIPQANKPQPDANLDKFKNLPVKDE